MPSRIDFSGMRFGRLIVLKATGERRHGSSILLNAIVALKSLLRVVRFVMALQLVADVLAQNRNLLDLRHTVCLVLKSTWHGRKCLVDVKIRTIIATIVMVLVASRYVSGGISLKISWLTWVIDRRGWRLIAGLIEMVITCRLIVVGERGNSR
jgi:hypothetical protein